MNTNVFKFETCRKETVEAMYDYTTPKENQDGMYHLERVYFNITLNGVNFKYDVKHSNDGYFYRYRSFIFDKLIIRPYIMDIVETLSAAAANSYWLTADMSVYYAVKCKNTSIITTVITQLIENGLDDCVKRIIKNWVNRHDFYFRRVSDAIIGCICSSKPELLQKLNRDELNALMAMMFETHGSEYVTYIIEAIAAVNDGYDPMKKFEL